MEHQGIFSRGLFDGGSLGDADLGTVIDPPQPVSNIDRYRNTYGDQVPSSAALRNKGVTHFTVTPLTGDTGVRFAFYENGQPSGVAPAVAYTHPSAAVTPTGKDAATPPVFREGDGLLPAATTDTQNGSPKWLPWALLGGGLLVAGGIVYASAKKPVKANRKRRRRKR